MLVIGLLPKGGWAVIFGGEEFCEMGAVAEADLYVCVYYAHAFAQ